MSTELVQINNSIAPLEVEEMDDGLAGSVKLKPGQLKLVQPTSTSDVGDARPGQILESITQRCLDSITLVPLKVSTARAYFPPGEGLKAPLCKSDNGSVPAPYVEHKQSSSCASCKFAQWGKRVNGKAAKPLCGEQFRMLVLDKDTNLPYYVTFKGTGYAPAKEYLELVKSTKGLLAQKGLNYNLRDFYFTLVLDPRINTQGKYWVPKFTKTMYSSEAGKYDEAYNIFARYNQSQQEEDEAAAIEEVVNSHVTDAFVVEAEPV